MIDPQTIQHIFDAADIIDVISEFVNLKKSGANFKGFSPFNDEKSPSFFVSPSKGIYKDFSSGKGGNVVQFLMEVEKMSYVDALKWLAKKYHIEIEEKERTPEEIQRDTVRESLFIVNTFAQKYFSQILKNDDEGRAIGLSYFKERGFNDQSIDSFQLGYAPEGRTVFTEYAQKNGYRLEYLEKTGLTIVKGDYHFDRFHGRVIFPIHSISGKIVGFGGRILKKDDKIAKYLNSPESEIYHKSHHLYGLYFAKNEIIKREKCYLVEGYTDVISMHQNGIKNVVASSGTSLTTDQIRLLKRFSNYVTIIFDGDAAGIKASLRGIDLILEQGLNVKILLLPDGDDPDSFSKKYKSAEFQSYIDNHEEDFITFKTRLLLGDVQNDPVKKAQLINDIVKTISVIPDGITRTLYIRECSRLMEMSEEIINTEVNRHLGIKREEEVKRIRREQVYQRDPVPSIPFENQEPAPIPEVKSDLVPEREIIRLLLVYGDHEIFSGADDDTRSVITVVEHVLETFDRDDTLKFQNPLYQTIFDEIKSIHRIGKPINTRNFINHPEPHIALAITQILTEADKYGISKIWLKNDNYIETEDMKLREIIQGTFSSLQWNLIEKWRSITQLELKQAIEQKDEQKVNDKAFRIQILIEIRNVISRKSGRVA